MIARLEAWLTYPPSWNPIAQVAHPPGPHCFLILSLYGIANLYETQIGNAPILHQLKLGANTFCQGKVGIGGGLLGSQQGDLALISSRITELPLDTLRGQRNSTEEKVQMGNGPRPYL